MNILQISYDVVGKMQFSLSDIAAPDSLVGHHKTQQDPIRLSIVAGPFKEDISIDNLFIPSGQDLLSCMALLALAWEVISYI